MKVKSSDASWARQNLGCILASAIVYAGCISLRFIQPSVRQSVVLNIIRKCVEDVDLYRCILLFLDDMLHVDSTHFFVFSTRQYHFGCIFAITSRFWGKKWRSANGDHRARVRKATTKTDDMEECSQKSSQQQQHSHRYVRLYIIID